jgi:hypothetical protein
VCVSRRYVDCLCVCLGGTLIVCVSRRYVDRSLVAGMSYYIYCILKI